MNFQQIIIVSEEFNTMQLKFGFQCQGTEFLLKKHCSVDPTFRNDLYNHVHDCHFFSLHRIIRTTEIHTQKFKLKYK
jgi:hypothetical protein